MAIIRMAGVVRESIVDGPGIRFVVFTQGCPHHCEGCHNPQTHDFAGGYDCDSAKILEAVDQDPLVSGVTFSGGEPFSQPEALAELARAVKARGLSLISYSGWTYEQLEEIRRTRPAVGQLLDCLDYLIDGKFVLARRNLNLQFRGSDNQRIVDMAATRQAGHAVTTEL